MTYLLCVILKSTMLVKMEDDVRSDGVDPKHSGQSSTPPNNPRHL